MTATSPEHKFLGASLWEYWPNVQTDQKRGLAAPPCGKPCSNEFMICYAPVGMVNMSELFEEGDAT